MKYNPEIHHRRSIRLKGYDYSQNGLYFITICTQNRHHLFGTITNGQMALNPMGEIAHNEWSKTASMRPNIRLHEFIVMPNHIHGIIEIIPAPVHVDCIRPLDVQQQSGRGQRATDAAIADHHGQHAGNIVRIASALLMRNNNRGAGNAPLRWVILCGGINPLSPNTLTPYATPPAYPYGNAITTNTLFGTKPPI